MLEPLAAPLDGVEEVRGEVLAEPLALDEPPEAESFFVVSADEEELEEDGGVLGAAPAELEDEEPGVVGFTVTEPDVELEPDGAVAEPDGAVAEPDGVVVEPLDDEEAAPGCVVRARSPALSPQAVSRLAPKSIDTATAKVERLMLWPPWLG